MTKTPRFLITGANGQLGFELQRALAPLGEVVACGRDACDLSNPASIRAAVLDAARAETAMFEIREKARGTVAEMIRALLPPEYKDCDIEIRWSDDPVRGDR
jgi:NAD(P)-dependent dehydrogenase (short-subunit alcohol dehydrogenase family)